MIKSEKRKIAKRILKKLENEGLLEDFSYICGSNEKITFNYIFVDIDILYKLFRIMKREYERI